MMEGEEERGKDRKIGVVSIMKSSIHHTDFEGLSALNDPSSQEIPHRKKVTVMGSDYPLPLSPSKPLKHFLDPNQKPIRTSGLDCGDIDPFVQSDSFVYLAVSARPSSHGDVTTMTEFPTHDTKQDSIQTRLDDTMLRSYSMKRHLDLSTQEQDAKLTHLAPQKPEEGDFLCTDSFVYLAAPACLLLGPAGTTSYSGRYVQFFFIHYNPGTSNLFEFTEFINSATDQYISTSLSVHGGRQPSKVTWSVFLYII